VPRIQKKRKPEGNENNGINYYSFAAESCMVRTWISEMNTQVDRTKEDPNQYALTYRRCTHTCIYTYIHFENVYTKTYTTTTYTTSNVFLLLLPIQLRILLLNIRTPTIRT
jgi:hypothetical protein